MLPAGLMHRSTVTSHCDPWLALGPGGRLITDSYEGPGIPLPDTPLEGPADTQLLTCVFFLLRRGVLAGC